ncbi:MAG: DoxX family protein [Cyclobacteriaceae bacterium]
MNVLAAIVRFLVGGLFIFSGLIKINDPVGTAIKMQEYFEVFSTDFGSFFHVFVPFSLPIAIFICVLEVVLGLAILLNYRTNISFIVLLFLLIFFTFLTFYSAYYNKVTDCGCFGDAIKLTPWQSFYKDIILVVLSVLLFFISTTQQSAKFQKISDYVILVFTALNIGLAVYAVKHLPYIDFRAYKIGNDIPTEMQPSGELKYEYVMEKDGQEYRFETYPTDKSYKYKEMITLNPEVNPKITDYAVWNDEGDFTESTFEGKKLFLTSYDISKASTKNAEAIGQLKAQLQGKVEVIILTASGEEEVSAFREASQLDLPFYYADATVLKTIARSNPGLWLLDNGTVKGKWHFNDVPDYSKVLGLVGM